MLPVGHKKGDEFPRIHKIEKHDDIYCPRLKHKLDPIRHHTIDSKDSKTDISLPSQSPNLNL